jgi:hypothetical protein
MSAQALLAELADRRVVVIPLKHDLLIDAPPGALTPELRDAIAEQKQELIRDLSARPQQPRNTAQTSPLAEYAADRLPKVRLTVRQSEDLVGDVKLMNRIREAIAKFQPGGNHIYVRIVPRQGRSVVVEAVGSYTTLTR